MKLIYPIIAIAALSAVASCKCSGEKVESLPQEQQQTARQAALLDTLSADTQRLIETASHLNPAPFIERDAKGEVVLSEKEKMIKPDYLLDPARVKTLNTLSQKYRAIAVLGVDRLVADLYEMPQVVDYDEAIYTLVVDINDGAIAQFVEKRHFTSDDLSLLIDGEYAMERGTLLWEFLAGSVIEQMSVLAHNIDKLLPMFNDSSVTAFCNNVAIVHDALNQLCSTDEDLAPLRDALLPLYGLKATTVEELHLALVEMKGAIELSRHNLLK